MASAVDIANLALGHLGDSATVSSLDPPEGSAQAEHCARFYPVARNGLLEMHPWNFATRRAPLAQLDNPSSSWQFAYALPSNLVSVLAVLPKDAIADYEASFYDGSESVPGYRPLEVFCTYTPQPYVIENGVLLTNVEDAVCRYTEVVTDTTKFSHLFVMALSYLLASMLAGPIIKGDAGAAQSRACLGQMQVFLQQAKASDASQRKVDVTPAVPWLNGR